jgi:hypothetical protein
MVERVTMDLLGGRQWKAVGDGAVFRYAYARVETDPDWGAWLLNFHSAVICLVVLSPDEGEHQDGSASRHMK